MVFVFALTVIFSPISGYGVFASVRNILSGNGYKKVEIKIDSVSVDAANFSDGGQSSDYYTIFSHDLDRDLTLTDHEKSWLFSRKGEDRLVEDMYRHRKDHGDSIWIWYHPSATIRYAREEDTMPPLGDEVKYLLLNGVFFIMAVYGIIFQVKQYRKRKTQGK